MALTPECEQRRALEVTESVTLDRAELRAGCDACVQRRRIGREALGIAHRLQCGLVEITEVRYLVPRRPTAEGTRSPPLRWRERVAQSGKLAVLGQQGECNVICDRSHHLTRRRRQPIARSCPSQ